MFILNRWFVLIKKIRKPLNVTLTFLTRDLIDFPQILVKKKKRKKRKKKNGLINLYYIHFRITGSPFNLSGSHWCDLFTNRTIFRSKSHLFSSQWQSFNKTQQPITFQNECNKVVIKLRDMQLWSEIILVISNQIGAARSFNFQITRMFADHIAFHSLELPLWTSWIVLSNRNRHLSYFSVGIFFSAIIHNPSNRKQ